MKAKNKVMFMTVAVMAGIFLMIIGVTYTWFNVIIKPEDEASTNVVVKAANLGTITFYNGEEISMDGVYPGWCETKKVSIKSEDSTVTNDYSVYLNVAVNELAELGSTYGYVTMKSTVVDAETQVATGSTGTLDLQNIQETSGKILLLTGKLGVEEIHTYNIEFCFPELGIDQNSQQGKAFNAYLSAESGAVIDTKENCETAVAFSSDSWETISCNVKNGTIAEYNVGDTKEVTLDGYGTHTLRIANTSTPEECSTTGFSQSACGFVLEFTDILAKYNINPAGTYNGNYSSYGTSLGGWPASAMYKYINNNVYNSLPEDLISVIIDTTVVSGHGKTDTTNFTSTDKLYLLDAKEIYGTSFTSSKNTAKAYERQLDYYLNKGTTTSSYSAAKKKYNGSNYEWWLRTARSNTNLDIDSVSSEGSWSHGMASVTYGVSPAFRIG